MRNFFILLLLILIFYLVVFPTLQSHLSLLSGSSQLILDTRLGYSPEQVYTLLSDLGAQGRMLYGISALTLDLIFPLIYTAWLWIASGSLIEQLGLKSTRFIWLKYAPLITLAADLLENACIVVLILSYPAKLVVLARAASVFTLFKWGSLSFSLILLIAGSLGLLRKRSAQVVRR